MDGSDKLTPLVIRKSANPRYFGGTLVSNLTVSDKAHKKRKDDVNHLEGMADCACQRNGKENTKICLLMDNCLAHNVKELKLEAVEIVFLVVHVKNVLLMTQRQLRPYRVS